MWKTLPFEVGEVGEVGGHPHAEEVGEAAVTAHAQAVLRRSRPTIDVASDTAASAPCRQWTNSACAALRLRALFPAHTVAKNPRCLPCSPRPCRPAPMVVMETGVQKVE